MGEVFVFHGRKHTIEYFPSIVWASSILIRGDKNILVDPGGILPADLPEIDEIWITHAHPDHISCAWEFNGADVYVHPAGVEILMSKNPGRASTRRELQVCLEKISQVKGWRRRLFSLLAHTLVRGFGLLFFRGGQKVKRVFPFKDGESRYGIRVLFTPGHSPDGVSFFFEDMGIAITGDLVTGKSTKPANLFTPSSNPEDALASLKKLSRLNINIMLPGHGRPIFNAMERIEEAIRLTEEEIECIRRSHPWKGYLAGMFHIQRCIHKSRKIIARLSAFVFYGGKIED